jgi:hypothetical protein
VQSQQAIGRVLIRRLINPVMRAAGIKPSVEEFKTDLRAEEAKIGAQLFGKIPDNTHREFYRADRQTWIWKEGKRLPTGGYHETTTSYLITDHGILKQPQHGKNHYISGSELQNFHAAVRVYARHVRSLYASL